MSKELALELCHKIEGLPASELQTEVSIMAGELHDKLLNQEVSENANIVLCKECGANIRWNHTYCWACGASDEPEDKRSKREGINLPAIKPCPFCGCEIGIEEIEGCDCGEGVVHLSDIHLRCPDCLTICQLGNWGDFDAIFECAIIEKWNGRVRGRK